MTAPLAGDDRVVRLRGNATATSAPQPNGHGQDAAPAGRDRVLRSDKGKPIELSGGPYDYAQAFLDARHDHKEGRTLHFYRGAFHAWTGTHYRELTDVEVRTELYDFLDDALVWRVPKGKTTPELVPFKPNRNHVHDIVDALRARAFLSDETAMPSWLGEVPTKGTVIPLRNGLLDLATDHLHGHSPRYLQSYSLPFDYDPCVAEPVQWQAFLEEIWPDDIEARNTLQEMMGLLITPDTSHHKIFLIVGPPRAGKGTILRVIKELLGACNCAGPTLSGLSTQFGLEDLLGKPVAIISDARLSGRQDSAVVTELLLSISGEDPKSVQRKHKTSVTCTLPSRFVIMSNELPKLDDASGAIATRFVTLIMTVSFLGREDHALFKKLVPELAGIFNWALEGRRRLEERGHFDVPQSSKEAMEELKKLSSAVYAFFSECCVQNPQQECTADKVFKAWKEWCDVQGTVHPGTVRSLTRKLRAVFPRLKTDRRRPWPNAPKETWLKGFYLGDPEAE